jgi:tetratricopeptide (TPR) repeat protein/serine phosphatase RsbU (regulator of sigma subunit)
MTCTLFPYPEKTSVNFYKRFFFSTLFFVVVLASFSQQKTIDSMYTAIVKAKHDTTRAALMLAIGEKYFSQKPDSSVAIWERANAFIDQNLKKTLSSAESKSFKRLYASSITNIGFYAVNSGNLDKGVENYKKAMAIYEELNLTYFTGIIHINLGDLYIKRGDYKKGLAELDQAVKIQQEKNDRNGLMYSYNNIGNAHNHMGNITEALENFLKALKLAEALNHAQLIAVINNNIAYIYEGQGNIPKALEYWHGSLKKMEEIKYVTGVATVMNNLALTYSKQGEEAKALEYLNKSLSLYESIGSKEGVAKTQNNIGKEFFKANNYEKALDYYQKSLKNYEELGDKKGIAYASNNIGTLYDQSKEFTKALDYYRRGLTLLEEIGDKPGSCSLYGNIGTINYNLKSLPAAEENYIKALELARKVGSPELIRNIADKLKIVYADKGDYQKSVQMYDLYIQMKDSINNETTKKASVKSQLKYEFEKKEALAKAEFEKQQALSTLELEKKQILLDRNKQELVLLSQENALKQLTLNQSQLELKQKEAEGENQKKEVEILNKDKKLKEAEAAQKEEALQRQRLITYSFAAGGLLVLGLLFFAVRGYIQKQKDNKVIIQQKKEVEIQKKEAEHQKDLVQEKQKEIVDSINYARRLQTAILPPESYIQKYLPDHFVYYQPKDIVAGDFYWMEHVDDVTFFAAADSTGHGVPGALVSVVCSNALNRALFEFGIRDTGKLLDKVTEMVLETFAKSGEEIKDGMDVSLIAINRKRRTIHWSGANNPLWLIEARNTTGMIEITADKQPIGKSDDPKPFTSHQLNYNEGDTFYLMTDGFADQFGGPKGKKFKYKQLEELLLSLSSSSLGEQAKVLKQNFNAWKGHLEQIDDVTIIGFRI